ncbi:polysaccharide lyase 8 family protein [Streptomyces sp. NPDC048187]|uniref:polysaccharide lyase 8 family protein n=1 Tax=Streptomyces sp. NPDC048187 TaxID=3365509 RepID=UPI003723731F
MSSPWSRRAFVRAAAASPLTATVGGVSVPAALAATRASAEADAQVFADLRAKWRELLLGTAFNPAAEPFRTLLGALGADARAHLDAMAPADGSLWPDLVWKDPDPDTDAESYEYSGRLATSCTRLSTMAQAYCQPGTGLTGDAGLRDAVVAGLGHIGDEVFNDRTVRYGNWWSWQIGAPQALMDTCVLLHDELPRPLMDALCRAVDHFVPESVFDSYTGTSTGANRVDLCRGLILRGIVGEAPDKVAVAARALAPVFPYVTSGDGFYADGSFIQHRNVPYIGGYGAVLHEGVGRLMALLRGTPWEIGGEGARLFLDTVESAVAPFIYNGLMMDNVSSRGVSRAGTSDHSRAHALMATVVLLGQGATAQQNDRWRAMVKGWLRRDYHYPALSNRGLGLPRTALLQALEDDDAVKAAPEPVGHRLFHHMDRVTHRGRDWAGSVSMASERITHYEFGNGENARGYHTGAGWLSWWGDDFGLEHYADEFWPTVDPYRLPGITASRKPLPDGAGGNWGQPCPDTAWVGGTTDGRFGATGQHLKGLLSTMSAHKSWFWLDDCVVCLGAGITSADGHAVETTIDNRNLGAAGSPALIVDGVVQPSSQGWSASFEGVRWAQIAGQAGYLFPEGCDLRAVREERTGAWRDINAGGPADPVTRRYLTLLTDHGTDPADAGYAYVVLPGVRAATTARRAADRRWLTILANSREQQGVCVPGLGFTAVNFWAAGAVGRLSADAPASVLVREHRDGTATVVVSDPARRASSLEVVWDRAVSAVLSKPSTVTSARCGSRLRLGFGDLTGQAGAPQKVRVRLGRR